MKKKLTRIFAASALAFGMAAFPVSRANAEDTPRPPLEISLQSDDGEIIPCPEVNDYLKKFTADDVERRLAKNDPVLTEELNRFATYCTARFDDAATPAPDFHSAGKNAPPVPDDLMGVTKTKPSGAKP